jgi:chemotaxis signal transduction protein
MKSEDLKIGEPTSSAALPAQPQRTEEVWRERAHRLAQRPNLAGAGQNTLPVVVLGIGNERYGIDLADVAEVFPPLRSTPVPGAPAAFAGVINVHGEIRPVIDLRSLLGMETVCGGEMARVVLLRRGGRELGLQVDSVEQIRQIVSGEAGSGHLSPEDDGGAAPRTVYRAGPQASPHIKGTTQDLLMLLSTEALFAELDVTGLHKGLTN